MGMCFHLDRIKCSNVFLTVIIIINEFFAFEEKKYTLTMDILNSIYSQIDRV